MATGIQHGHFGLAAGNLDGTMQASTEAETGHPSPAPALDYVQYFTQDST
ncbi:hypothetical protein [Streptomyces sp. NPDC058861]